MNRRWVLWMLVGLAVCFSAAGLYYFETNPVRQAEACGRRLRSQMGADSRWEGMGVIVDSSSMVTIKGHIESPEQIDDLCRLIRQVGVPDDCMLDLWYWEGSATRPIGNTKQLQIRGTVNTSGAFKSENASGAE